MGRVTSRIRHDYKPGRQRSGYQGRLQRIVIRAVGLAVAAVVIFALFGPETPPAPEPEGRPMVEADPSSSDAGGSSDNDSLHRRALALPPASGSTALPASGGSDVPERKAPAPDAAPDAGASEEKTDTDGPETMAAADDAAPATPAAPTGETITLKVGKGDSLDSLFRRNNLSVADLALMLRLKEAKSNLRTIRPGDEIEVVRADEHVLSLTRRVDERKSLRIVADGEGYRTETIDHPVEHKRMATQGRIDSSLFLAGAAAGMSDTLIMNFAGIFAWDVDFALEVREGDTFSLVYEEVWQDGEKLRDGNILAAEFVNQNEVFRAVRFENPEGRVDYFTPDGLSVRKAFLRAPLDFRRVSSNFNPNRLHPILKTKRPHRGVDYAANRGTPIRAAGDGRIILRGRNGGYGNCVIIQHGGNITTLYGHLSRFAKGQKNGTRVRQGQTIGYVGATGLATAPHLHYEYRLNGVHRNPRTVSLPAADPVPKAYREQFAESTRPLLKQLNAISPTRLAASGETIAFNPPGQAGDTP